MFGSVGAYDTVPAQKVEQSGQWLSPAQCNNTFYKQHSRSHTRLVNASDIQVNDS